MSDKSEYYISLKKTGLSSLLGIIGGVIAFYISKTPTDPLKREAFGFLVLFFLVWIQKSVLPLIDVDVSEFGGKDWAFIGLMTFSFGFISWTLLLNL